MFSTINVSHAKFASEVGVDRIWVDLENLNKLERQGGKTRISTHLPKDIAPIRKSRKNRSTTSY